LTFDHFDIRFDIHFDIRYWKQDTLRRNKEWLVQFKKWWRN